MSDESLAKAPGKILHVPTVAGAVVITFNEEGVNNLKLDGPTIADIFLGKITKWNDPAIAKQNKGVKLPDDDISVVHRSDGSGTSYIFTDYLSTVSADWKSKVGKATSVSWPAGLGAKGNEGVAGSIKQTPGSIGYVELIYALQNKLPFADIKNADGEYVKGVAGLDHRRTRHGQHPGGFSLLDGQRARQDFLSHRRGDLAARLPATEGRRQGRQARRILEMGHEGRREHGQGPRLRIPARDCTHEGARRDQYDQTLIDTL